MTGLCRKIYATRDEDLPFREMRVSGAVLPARLPRCRGSVLQQPPAPPVA
jgi:hypothetical protein